MHSDPLDSNSAFTITTPLGGGGQKCNLTFLNLRNYIFSPPPPLFVHVRLVWGGGYGITLLYRTFLRSRGRFRALRGGVIFYMLLLLRLHHFTLIGIPYERDKICTMPLERTPSKITLPPIIMVKWKND